MVNTIKSQLRTIIADEIVGALDYFRFPNLKNNLTSFTSQKYRRLLVQNLVKIKFTQNIVETGAYKGDTTNYFKQSFNLPVYTVELNKRHYGYVKTRFYFDKIVKVYKGDSRDFIKNLIKIKINETNTFFYLDAHWGHDLPLIGELDLILNNWKKFIIIIDDFQVPENPFYKFDRYKEKNEHGIYCFTKVLCLELIQNQLNQLPHHYQNPCQPLHSFY